MKIKYNSKSNRTSHWHEINNDHGRGISLKRLTHEENVKSLRKYLKDQAKYILLKPRSARIG